MQHVPDNFTHLEIHSHYTLLGGTASVKGLVQRAAAENLSALALTDTNALYGIVQFAKLCMDINIKPVIGMAVDVAAPPGILPADNAAMGRLVLLADGVDGYRSLCRLSSHMQVEQRRNGLERRRLEWETLKSHQQGLICLSGGRLGWIERLLRAEQPKLAARYAARLGGLFEESCYLSICPQDIADPLSQEIVELGKRFGLPPVAVQPIYCLQAEDAPRLRLLAAIDHNCRYDELDDSFLPNLGDTAVPIHWPSKEEVADRFSAFPDALATVTEIVDRCNPGLPDGRPIWPGLVLPGQQTPEQALINTARVGLSEKYGLDPGGTVKDRLAKELATITGHGFAPLFLIVADIARFARQEDIPVNTRGSVANSLVAYCAGITQVDPIKHDLLFERFLNPARSNLPDIDLDFCSRRRDEVLDYVRRTYGEDQVALVGTMNTLQPKSALRETAKAYGLSEEDTKKLAARIPRRWHPDPRRRQKWQIEDVLAEIDDELLRTVMRAAYAIIGQPHHLSIHPGGVVLTPGPLTDTVPLQLAPKGFLITQYDYRDIELVGLPKLDLLGIRALTVLADAAELIRENHDPQFRLTDIPLDDELTAVLLSAGATIGVFQCESVGARRTLRKLKVKDIRDLAVANAFFKPGPATGGMAQSFVRRYRGEEEVRFLHPALELILGPTQGVLLFQEQILRIAREIAGLSWAQADGLRKGMSKFQPQEMKALETEFLSGCQRPQPDGPGFSTEQASTLWEQVVAFAGYGFNQGHATAYADVSYRSAYLKAHYTAEFLCARLADRGGFHHPAIYIAEAKRLGIAVRPPHVNFSNRRFTLLCGQTNASKPDFAPGETLWMGLGQVRDLRRKTVATIMRERDNRFFIDLPDLMARVPMHEKEIRHLICCGALDGLGESRSSMLDEAVHIARAGSRHQLAFDFARDTAVTADSPADHLRWETELLGLPVSVHPLELIRTEVKTVRLRQLPEMKNTPVSIQGVRLPGWTGDKGFFLGDSKEFIVVIPPRQSGSGNDSSSAGRRKGESKPWQPLLLEGWWREDEWGGGWFQAESVNSIT